MVIDSMRRSGKGAGRGAKWKGSHSKGCEARFLRVRSLAPYEITEYAPDAKYYRSATGFVL